MPTSFSSIEEKIRWVINKQYHWITGKQKTVSGGKIDSSAEFSISMPRTLSAPASRSDFSSVEHHIRNIIQQEELVLKAFIQAATDDDVFFDIGAGYGVYTVFVGRALVDGMVIAFEPDIERVLFVRDNIELNEIDGEVINAAIGEEVSLLRTPKSSSLIVTSEEIRKFSIPNPTLIKIDVEGMELEVLKGILPLLRTCRIICIELHEESTLAGERQHGVIQETEVKRILELLKDADFEVSRREGPAYPFLWGERVTD